MSRQCVINVVSDVCEDLLVDGVQITTPMLYGFIAGEICMEDRFSVADVATEWVNNIGAPYELSPMLCELMTGWTPEVK